MHKGRRGHARVVVLTVVDEELEAVQREFGATEEVESEESGIACWTTADSRLPDCYAVIVAQSQDRSNMPSQQTTRDLIEDWRPEVIVLVGIAGGIVRLGTNGELDGPATGDVICIDFVHYADYAKRAAGKRQPRYFPVQHPDTNLVTSHLMPVAQSDWYSGIPEARPGADNSPQLHRGEVVAVEFLAGDGDAAEQQDALEPYDHALGVDMESAGVARAMHTASRTVNYRPVWLGFRGISDLAPVSPDAKARLGQSNDDERKLWKRYSAAAAARAAHLTVQRLLRAPRPRWDDPGAPKWDRTALSEGAERIGK